nr:DUF4433 domain-containing protein [uncultured Desulfobulbus sp.]
MYKELINPEKALIFRIVHRDNVAWVFANGMHSRNSMVQCPSYRTIGNPELIDRRKNRSVDIDPGGTLSNYVPFYFTPFTPMMLNIKTGYGGVAQVSSEEIVIFVSSLRKLETLSHKFIFTDRHAYLVNAEFFSDLNELSSIDWHILQNRDFRRDPDDPGKFERYQAEALVHDHVPVTAFIGAVCYTEKQKKIVSEIASDQGLEIKVIYKPGWYC